MSDLWLLRHGETAWTTEAAAEERRGLERERRVIRRWNEVCHLEERP